MSRNDLTSLKQNFEAWQEGRGRDLEEIPPFSYYCLEHALKSRDVDDEELQAGWTDGAGDMGVDALYVFMNGQCILEDVKPQEKVTKVEVLVFQLKDRNGGGFSFLEVDKWNTFIEDFLNIQGDVEPLRIRYNKKLLGIMLDFRQKYSKIGGQLPEFTVKFIYIARCDGCEPDEQTVLSMDRVKQTTRDQMSAALIESEFINVQSLLEIVKSKPSVKKLLVFEEVMASEDGYVGVVRLETFFEFITDEHKQWNARLFDANVRGWQRHTPVNTRIRETLSSQGPNFWLLNNGITLLATQANHSGGSRNVFVTDPQIVNGLQTSRAIFDHFSSLSGETSDSRSVLVRIIRSSDRSVYERIVRATNDQNTMAPASLRSTDAIHGYIDELFSNNDLYYDRKKGHYKDEGKPASKIVPINELLQAVVSIVVGRPDDARARPGDYISKDAKYNRVFKKDVLPTSLYLSCILLSRRVTAFLAKHLADQGDRRNIKFYVMYHLARLAIGTYNPVPDEIESLNVVGIPERLVKQAYDEVWAAYAELGQDDHAAKGVHLLARLKELYEHR